MTRLGHVSFEVLDRSSGTRYRVDPDEHPRDLISLLVRSGRYVVRPIVDPEPEPAWPGDDRERYVTAGRRR